MMIGAMSQPIGFEGFFEGFGPRITVAGNNNRAALSPWDEAHDMKSTGLSQVTVPKEPQS
jgi:hypothetical protein